MKRVHILLAPLMALLAASLALAAAEPKQASRVIGILEVDTDDPVAYATWLKQYNEIAKAKVGVDPYLRVYQSVFDSRATGHVRVVTSAATIAELMKAMQALENDPAIIANRDHLRSIRKTGARILYQAIRFEGPNPRGSHNFNSLLTVSDEPGYLQAIGELRRLFDSGGFKDAKIAVYRAVAGRTDHSHRVTISLPSAERLAALLDYVGSDQQVGQWLANSAKLRTVVANNTSREITKY